MSLAKGKHPVRLGCFFQFLKDDIVEDDLESVSKNKKTADQPGGH